MRKNKFNEILLLTVFLLNLIISTNSVLFAEETKITSKKIEEYNKRLQSLLEPKIQPYESEGKNDPFIPFIKQQPRVLEADDKRPQVCENPIECLDVGQLQIVSIVTFGSGKRIAMVQDATTQGYVLLEGMRVGYREGRVKTINPDGLVISETGKDILGNQVKTEKILLIHPEGR